MPDVVTREERALINAALVAIPLEARQVPAGVSGLLPLEWDGERLRMVGLKGGWRGLQAMRSRGARAAARTAQSRVSMRNALICQDARAGMSYAALVAKYEVSKQMVYKITARAGVGVAPAVRTFSDAEALTARIVALADGVRTVRQIAEMAGCSPRSVRARRDDLGLDIPKGLPGKPVQWRIAA